MNEDAVGLPVPRLGIQGPGPRPIKRTVYPVASFRWGGPDLIPGIEVQAAEETRVLMFEVDGSEQIAFVFTEQGKRALIEQLTGGVATPGRLHLPPGSENGG